MFGSYGSSGWLRQSIEENQRFVQGVRNSSDSTSALQARRDAQEAAERLDKLTLICWAMWTLMSEKLNLSEEDLMQRVRDLDTIDGDADGKVTRSVVSCPKCQRTMSPRHRRCLYCGFEPRATTAFDAML